MPETLKKYVCLSVFLFFDKWKLKGGARLSFRQMVVNLRRLDSILYELVYFLCIYYEVWDM